jgi:uncharacterized protein
MRRSELLKSIKEAVATVDPQAEVILYGSQARGDGVSGSDWDILVLGDQEPDLECRQAIRAQLYEIEWTTGEVISAVIKSRREWNLPELNHSPFHRNVKREGVRL